MKQTQGGLCSDFQPRKNGFSITKGKETWQPPPPQRAWQAVRKIRATENKEIKKRIRRTPRGRQGEQTLLKATESAETEHILAQHAILQRASGRNKIPWCSVFSLVKKRCGSFVWTHFFSIVPQVHCRGTHNTHKGEKKWTHVSLHEPFPRVLCHF